MILLYIIGVAGVLTLVVEACWPEYQPPVIPEYKPPIKPADIDWDA